MAGVPLQHSLLVTVVGDTFTGKSSLVSRFAKDEFIENRAATLGAAFMTKTIPTPSTKFEIWDTAGQARFASCLPLYCRKADATIIVYDITKAESFIRAKALYWDMKEHLLKNPHMTILLAGNKADLDEQRMVTTQEAHAFAVDNSLMFVETSAATSANVWKMFQLITPGATPAEVIIASGSHHSFLQARPDGSSVFASASVPLSSNLHIWRLHRVADGDKQERVALENVGTGKFLSARRNGNLRCDVAWLKAWEMWNLVLIPNNCDAATAAWASSLLPPSKQQPLQLARSELHTSQPPLSEPQPPQLPMFGLQSSHGRYLRIQQPAGWSGPTTHSTSFAAATWTTCSPWERLFIMRAGVQGTAAAAVFEKVDVVKQRQVTSSN